MSHVKDITCNLQRPVEGLLTFGAFILKINVDIKPTQRSGRHDEAGPFPATHVSNRQVKLQPLELIIHQKD